MAMEISENNFRINLLKLKIHANEHIEFNDYVRTISQTITCDSIYTVHGTADSRNICVSWLFRSPEFIVFATLFK